MQKQTGEIQSSHLVVLERAETINKNQLGGFTPSLLCSVSYLSLAAVFSQLFTKFIHAFTVVDSGI